MTEPNSVHISDWVRDVLKDLDEKMLPTFDGYSEACIVAASYVAGADEKTIASALGFDQEFVDVVGNRLRSAKIWVGDQLSQSARARWNEHPMAMLADINVAKGEFVIARYEGDEPLYSLSPSGRKRAEKLLGLGPKGVQS